VTQSEDAARSTKALRPLLDHEVGADVSE
jgi:hypothetical protein